MAELTWLLVLILFIAALAVDRFIYKRGSINVDSCGLHDIKQGYWRFNLVYRLTGNPVWGQIKYSLRDKKNPSTVISGKPRELEHSTNGFNSEFLHIKKALTDTTDSNHDWELVVTASTVAGHFNPLYKLFPLKVKKIYKVNLNA